jgi:hypothetical protein
MTDRLDGHTRRRNPDPRTEQDHASIVDKREIGAYYFLHCM